MNLKLARLTTVPISLHLLISGQPNFMQNHGFKVIMASSDGPEINDIELQTGIKVKTLPFTREITPFSDIKALWFSYKYFKLEKPTIVHTHTPKAGIIGMLASKMAGVPIRMHTVAGLPLLEARGIKRTVLNTVERITSWAASGVYPNSFDLKNIMVKNKLANSKKLQVIGNGSSNGIDTDYFSKKHFSLDKIIQKRNYLGIDKDDLVFVFVGRIVKDKGINELLNVFSQLADAGHKSKLLLVGSEEKELDPLKTSNLSILKSNMNIIQTGWQNDVRLFLAISDIFIFPSYREGFPNVVMQAGAMDLPSIVTNINGCNEIIENEVNGLIIPPKDEVALFDTMQRLIVDKKLREKLSGNSREIITSRYEQKFVWNQLLKEYVRLMDKKDIKHHIKIEDK